MRHERTKFSTPYMVEGDVILESLHSVRPFLSVERGERADIDPEQSGPSDGIVACEVSQKTSGIDPQVPTKSPPQFQIAGRESTLQQGMPIFSFFLCIVVLVLGNFGAAKVAESFFGALECGKVVTV
ncbi:unnamed protein product [Calypogeia fissa]